MTTQASFCSNSAPGSVADYFEKGWRRQRSDPLPVRGDLVAGCTSLFARVSVAVKDGQISKACFQSSTCVPLVAYCELLVEMVEGKSLWEAMSILPDDLIDRLPEIPTYRRNRAALATKALANAVGKAMGSGLGLEI